MIMFLRTGEDVAVKKGGRDAKKCTGKSVPVVLLMMVDELLLGV